MPAQQISRCLQLESVVHSLVTEVQNLKDVSRRQHEFIRELYELKSTTASKAELHAAVAALRETKGGVLGTGIEVPSWSQSPPEYQVLETAIRSIRHDAEVETRNVDIFCG